MWPGRPPARARIYRASRSTTSNGASITPGSRLPWMPRSPMRRQASSSGRRQSTLMTSEPQRAIASRRCEVVVPKWIVARRSARPFRGCAGCMGAPRLVGRDGERARPRVEELDHLRAGLDLRLQIAIVTSVRVAMRRSQSSGSPWSIALVFENSLVGLPSSMYDATVNGPPANPTTAVLPSSSGAPA